MALGGGLLYTVSMKKIILVLLLLVSACAPRTAEKYTSFNVSDPVALRMLLAEMPKGADLHTHLSGIPYAEDYLCWAAEDGSCIDIASGKIVSGPCGNGTVAARTAYTDAFVWNTAVNSLSVREGRRDNHMWGHDQFFSTFGKMGASKKDKGRLLAHAVKQAERDKVQYLEVMISIYGPKWVSPWAKQVGWSEDVETTFMNLKLAGLFDGIAQAISSIDQAEIRKRQLVGDGAGKDVEVRYINQIFRGIDPAYVFAQLAWSFELVHRDPRVVGINMVGPEDAPIAVRDYALHMTMLDFLHQQYPDVSITLHAGELTGGLTSPEALSDHISMAVTKGHATRIGHGVDLAYEDGARDLLKLMKDRGVALEVLLGSNRAILHVEGKEHPLRTYMKGGVPVVIASDDMGVARSTMTDEYMLAVTDQGLSYADLKRSARNSLEYSFLPGKSLWKNRAAFEMVEDCYGDITPDKECSNYLSESVKAKQQWNLERKIKMFEKKYGF
ncbi:Adenosine/AMP deaminase [Maridesulfovibrio hydrothermalis AM13 = DSM 14728]|uniref:adenosine deaminase n=2 Tax=Maridesulfovibrio TaxID=2794998 RepID=L0RBH6_9BACT|nr:Adenosine/AMP deaminase [Maridesulfovibrio hydrothermalis AM13 = DSM 14728]